ncbi:MAG: radical SAM protein [Promethearchaeota archaeon]
MIFIELLKRFYSYRPLTTQLVVTRRCNLSCGYCKEFDHTSKVVSTDRLKIRIDKLCELKAMIITMTGGEPLLHPYIAELIKYAKSKIPGVGMITNGFLLSKEIIMKLNKSGLGAMQISIDGVHQNEITKKVLDNVKDKLMLLKKYAKFKVNIASVLGSTPIEEVFEMIQFANKLDMDLRLLPMLTNGAIHMTKEDKKKTSLIYGSSTIPIWDIYFIQKLLREGKLPYKCRAGARFLYVDEFGYVHVCPQKKELFPKKFLMSYTKEDLVKNFYTPKQCTDTCCVTCIRLASFADEWRKQDNDSYNTSDAVMTGIRLLKMGWIMAKNYTTQKKRSRIGILKAKIMD